MAWHLTRVSIFALSFLIACNTSGQQFAYRFFRRERKKAPEGIKTTCEWPSVLSAGRSKSTSFPLTALLSDGKFLLMADTLSSSAQRVQDALAACGVSCSVIEMPATTRTAKEAAAAIGCTVAQIAKSIIFRTSKGGTSILVMASGVNRVNEGRVREIIGETIEIADAEYVREVTGFVIGGVPPVGHATPIRTILDADLLNFDVIWAAAGTPRAVFQVTPQDLKKITAGIFEWIT